MIFFLLLLSSAALGLNAYVKKQKQQQASITNFNFGGLPDIRQVRPDYYASSQEVKATSNMIRVEGGPFVFNPGYGLKRGNPDTVTASGTAGGAGGSGSGGAGGGGFRGSGGRPLR